MEVVNERSFNAALDTYMPNSGGRPTRDIIFEAAAELFLRQGYHGTSMRQVAAEAGVTPAAIYNYVEGKEQLFTELLGECLPYMALANAVSRAQGETAEDLLRDGMRRMRASVQGQVENIRLMFVELLEFQGRHVPDLAIDALPQALDFVQRIQDADGQLRRFPPMIILRVIAGLLISYVITTTFLGQIPGVADAPDDFEAFSDILLHGLMLERLDEAGAG